MNILLISIIIFSFWDCSRKETHTPKIPISGAVIDLEVFSPTLKENPRNLGWVLLKPGTIERTDSEYRDIFLDEQGFLRVSPGSEFYWTHKESIELHLLSGKFFLYSNPKKKERDIILNVGVFRIQLLGTSLFAQLESEKNLKKKKIPCEGEGCKVKISVIEGRVKADSKGKTKIIQSGEEANLQSGKKIKPSPISGSSNGEIQKILSHPTRDSGLEKNLREIRQNIQKVKNLEGLEEAVEKKSIEFEKERDIENSKNQIYREKEYQKESLKLNLEE